MIGSIHFDRRVCVSYYYAKQVDDESHDLVELRSALVQVGDAHDAARAKRVDLAYGPHLAEHVAQPLRVEEEQVAQRQVVGK